MYTRDHLPGLRAKAPPLTLSRALYQRLRVSEGRALRDALRRRVGDAFAVYADVIDAMLAEGALRDEGPPRWARGVCGDPADV